MKIFHTLVLVPSPNPIYHLRYQNLPRNNVFGPGLKRQVADEFRPVQKRWKILQNILSEGGQTYNRQGSAFGKIIEYAFSNNTLF